MANLGIPAEPDRLRLAATAPPGQSAMRGAALWLCERLADWHARCWNAKCWRHSTIAGCAISA